MPAKTDTPIPGRFVKGQSGNPKGRPPGVGKLNALRKMIEADAPAIVRSVADAALAGDTAAAKLLLDRILPPLKAESAPVRVPLGDADSLRAKAEAIVRAAADGALTADTAALLVNAIGTLARVIETDDLERRITELEQKSNETD